MRLWWKSAKVGFPLLSLAALGSSPAHCEPLPPPHPSTYGGTCPNGAPARLERYCAFFVHFGLGDHPLPVMVGDFLGVTQASDTRAIGLIIAIDDYPLMKGSNLSAAAVDAQRLQDFLITNQGFDEVIVLRNEHATQENIDYFLRDYLPNHADDFKGPDGQGRARLLIAYTGHGRAETPDAQAAFVLGSASDPKGSVGVYPMTSFTNAVQHLAPHYFHVLTLINTCFGANIFTLGNPGAAATPTAPGSFVMTAGSTQDEVQALLPKRGSLFFDLIINAVSRGEADPTAGQYLVTDGNSTAQPDVSLTLSQPLQSFLTAAFFRINTIQRKANPRFLAISPPFFGPVQNGMAQGSFFFVSKRPKDDGPGSSLSSLSPYLVPLAQDAVVETAGVGSLPPPPPPPSPVPLTPVETAMSLPIGPISSIKGRPEIKIFKPPVVYPFKGYDLSSADGKIDWSVFSRNALPQFIYARAVGWAGPDKTFPDRWEHARVLAVDRGAYIKFDFCRSPVEQLKRLEAVLDGSSDGRELPVAIELITPTADQPYGQAQLACYRKSGIRNVRRAILDLAQAVATSTGKIPLLKGNSYNLSVLTSETMQQFMIWLDAYGPPEAIAKRILLRGRNPWTLWDYARGLSVPGTGEHTTGVAFFGTAAQYAQFRRADVNVGLAAVQ